MNASEELGYFYDSIHGRIALAELPRQFHPALKAAFSSKALSRLKRIGQLGHTSVSFFSATHTRFSHAIGSMLIMNKLFNHVQEKGLAPEIFEEAKKYYPDAAKHFGNERTMVHCHLLLAALYQDVGELPFQKVTGQYFTTVATDVAGLVNEFGAPAKRWNVKTVFTILCLRRDLLESASRTGFAGFDLELLVYLITGDGAPDGVSALPALLQMVDGVVDADRLDYVYRDASVTIGSLSRPITVLESVVRYAPGCVIVDDPRPVTDFLSTRMRLWTFVYNAADVRFMHTLLKTVLDGYSDRAEARKAFEDAELEPELSLDKFMTVDDTSLMERVATLKTTHLQQYRKVAQKLVQLGTFDYEIRVLNRPEAPLRATPDVEGVPDELFFDLMLDEHQHQLYRPETVLVCQKLTSRIAENVALERSAGAFSPLFAAGNSAMIVKGGYYLFLPKQREGRRWVKIQKAIETGAIFEPLVVADAHRSLGCPSDTRNEPGFKRQKAISISYCFEDRPTVMRIVRELYKSKRRYHLYLYPFDGTGGTAAGNSTRLVADAKAVLVVASRRYLEQAIVGDSYINREVRAIYASRDLPVAVVSVDARSDLETVKTWKWGQLVEKWSSETPVVPNDQPLGSASAEVIRAAVSEALKAIDSWERK